MRKWWLVLCWLVSWCSGVALADPVAIRVGGYLFPPYVDLAGNEDVIGLTPDLLAALNRSQSQYRFEFVLTSPNRRFQDFAAGRFDMILFEDPRWGWANTMMEASQPILHDGDVFVASNSGGREQGYFSKLDGKRIYALRGYHYAFAGFDPNPELLKQRFGVDLLDPRGPSIDRGLQQVAAGQADLMIITASYLKHYFQSRPGMQEQLLVAEHYDSEYQLGALVRRQKQLTAAGFDQLLAELQANGTLAAVTDRYGVTGMLATSTTNAP